MGIKIIKEREPKESTSYSLEFDYRDDSGGGFTFPCDAFGNPRMDEMPDAAQINYKHCIEDTERFYKPYVKKHIHRWVEPAVGRCLCGEEVVLESHYMGACQCPKCGRWYNIYGQSLIPPEYWEYYEY